MHTAFLIALFGALGCLTRYLLSGWIYDLFGRTFPFGTLTVNLVGAFFIGLIMELGIRTTLISQDLRIGLTIGFLGGLTTFSTFSYETFKLLEDGEIIIASANVFTSVLACLVFTWAGILVARQI